jgi:hypothetical protein
MGAGPLSTPYQKYKRYFRLYHRQYWQTHPEYRKKQKQLKRERYHRDNRGELQRAKGYISAIYDAWSGTKSRKIPRKNVIDFATRVAIKRILPREGFRNIIWGGSLKSRRTGLQSVTGFRMFDALAFKDQKPCAIQITTSPFRQIRNRAALSTFLKFFQLTFCVVSVKPDVSGYYLSEYDADHVPHTVIMTPRRVEQLKTFESPPRPPRARLE